MEEGLLKHLPSWCSRNQVSFNNQKNETKKKTEAWFEAHGHQFAKKERWQIWTIFIEGISVGWLAGSFCWKNRRQYAFRGWQQQQHAPTEDSLLHQKAGLGNLLPGLSGWSQSKPLCGSSGLPDSIIFVDQEIQPSQAHQAGEVPQRVFKVSDDEVIMLKVFVSSCIASATKLNTTLMIQLNEIPAVVFCF